MVTIQQGSEEINSNGGISLIKKMFEGNESLKMLDAEAKKKQIQDSHIVKAMIGLFTLGKTHFADISAHYRDELFRDFLVGRIPSEETLRQRLDDLSGKKWIQEILDESNVESLKSYGVFEKERVRSGCYIPLDIDVSPFANPDCGKEGVEWTYKQIDGYAPIFAYLGGYELCAELRPGSQHSEKGAVKFLERCAKMIEKLGIPAGMILLRADSGHDSADFIAAARRFGFKFLIKRNLRKESREKYLDDARSMGYRVKTRKGKKVYRYIDSHSRPEGMEGIPMFKIVEVIVRYTDAETGESYLIPQLEVDTWWTNLPDSELECINLYHAHGTSEQYHSEIKSDIGLELFPSGKISTNALLLNIATLAFNALRTIGRLGIEKAPVHYERNRMRLRSVIQNFMYIACKVVHHARNTVLVLGRNNVFFPAFKEVFCRC